VTTRPPGPARIEGVVAGTFFAFVAQLTTAVFTAGVTLYLVRALGPESFGELALVLSVGGISLVVADAAIAQSTGRYAAVAADGDPERIAAIVSAGLRLKLALSLGAAVVLVTLADPIARAYGEPAMAWSLRLIALSVVTESVMLLWLVAFQALRRLSINVRLYLVESLAEAAAIVTLVTLGFGVAGAVLGRGLGYTVGAIAGAVLLTRMLGRRLSLRGDKPNRRQIATYARPLFVSTSIYSTYSQVDVQLIGALLNRSLVGIYAAPMRIIILLGYPGQALAGAVSPRMSGPDPEVGAFNSALRWLLIYQTMLMAPVILWAEPICVVLLGADYRESGVVLAAMAPFLFLNGMSALISTTVNYLGHARRRIPIVMLSLVINVVLDLILLPTIGVVGAAIGTSVSYLVYVPLHLRICRESFDVPLRPLATTLGRATLGTVAFGAILLAVGAGPGDPSVVRMLLAGTGGVVAYVIVLVATRELTGADARFAGDVWAGARSRMARG